MINLDDISDIIKEGRIDHKNSHAIAVMIYDYFDTIMFEHMQYKHEVNALRNQLAQRGAKMQIMYEWINRHPQWEPWTAWNAFVNEYPDAKNWFDANGKVR